MAETVMPAYSSEQDVATLNGNKTEYRNVNASSYSLYDHTNCTGTKAVFEALPSGFTGVAKATFANSINGSCFVQKYNNNYGTILVVPDTGGDAVYAQNAGGTWKQDTLAMNNNKEKKDNAFLLGDGATLIPNNTNINTLNTPGNYYISLITDAQTMTNLPMATAGTLYVRNTILVSGRNYKQQIFTPFDTLRFFVRGTIDNGSTWTAWDELALNSNLQKIDGTKDQVISSGDLNNYKATGLWRIGNIATLTHHPEVSGSTGILYVMVMAQYILQDFVNNTMRTSRFSYDGGTTWTDWQTVALNSQLLPFKVYSVAANSSVEFDVTNPCIFALSESDTEFLFAYSSGTYISTIGGQLGSNTVSKTSVYKLKITNNRNWYTRVWIFNYT